MKNTKKIFVALCAVASLAACAKSAGPDVQEEPWVNDETKRVPVQLKGNAMRMETKAGEINSLDGVEFGVYALGDLDKPQAVLFQDQWDDGCNCLPSHMENDMAVLETKDGPAYYPIYSTNNYSFYGFHVQDAQNVHLNVADDYTVEIPEYGLVDVLWAKAEATPVTNGSGATVDGFCAKYIREIYKQGIAADYLPKFNFSHQTAAFVFKVIAADEHAAETFKPENGNVRVTKAQVRNLPATAKLNILDGDINGETGTVNRECKIPATGIYPDTTGVKVGEFFLSPENEETLDNIEFEFTIHQRAIENEDNVYKVTGAQIRAKFLADFPAGSEKVFTNFEKGVRYTLNITLQSAEKIEISVSLSPWEDGFNDGILNIE